MNEWEDSPLGKWKREVVETLDYRSAEGKRLKRETNLSAKEIKEILKNTKQILKNKDGKQSKIPKIQKDKKIQKIAHEKLLESVKNNEKVHAFFVSVIIRILLKQKGPGYFNRMKSSNPEDFHSFELVKNIDRKDFHSFYDGKKIIFSFHVSSLMELVKCANKKNYTTTNQANQAQMMEIPKNPYTGKRIPKFTFKFICRKIEMESKNEGENKISEDQKVKIKLERLFQHIDSFGYITNLNWFLDMNLHALRQWYRLGEDLWNYRAQLTDIQKQDIAPMDAPFSISLNDVYRIHNRRTLQKIVLTQIENLIMYGENSTTQSLGCIYVLMIFTQTNSNIAAALPGIAQ